MTNQVTILTKQVTILNKRGKPRAARGAPMHSSVALEMQGIVRAAAEPWQPGDSVKAAMNRASRRLGLPVRRLRTLWYGHSAAILAEEADALRAWMRDWCDSEARRLECRARLLRDQMNDLENPERAAC